ncbi:hypothetical protein A6S26_32005 [Nostoc sp. ATCC 43529]|nr:hypothetical protein A6S26_32005 [Nostoc sp. ATCC 43529]
MTCNHLEMRSLYRKPAIAFFMIISHQSLGIRHWAWGIAKNWRRRTRPPQASPLQAHKLQVKIAKKLSLQRFYRRTIKLQVRS